MSEWKPVPTLPDLRRVGIIGLDTEEKDGGLLADRGSGWAFGDGYICGLSVAYRIDAVRAHYFPIRHPDSPNFDPEQVFQWLRDHIAAGVRFVTQNGLFDWGWLRTDAGIVMPPSEQLEEIGALATLVDETRKRYSLDALSKWRGLPGKDETLLKEAVIAAGFPKRAKPQTVLWQLPARVVGPYAEADPAATLALFESLNPILDREGTRNAYRLEVDLLPMCLEMRRRGIRIDISAAEQARDRLLRKRDACLAELSEKLETNIGMDELNRNAWRAAVFDQHKITYPRTEKGNPSFTAGNSGWMPKHPHWLPRLIVKTDKLHNAGTNVLGAYILGHVVNGRVYAEIHPHRGDDGSGTRSLRFSYSSPPLQLMPAHDEEVAPLIRGAFLPEEGEWWAKCDVSQQEFRLIVHYATRHKLTGAKEAAELYRHDPTTDFHGFVASLTGRDRQTSKNVNFARAFGAGVRKFAAMIGLSKTEAQTIYDEYDRRLPFVSQLSNLCERAARQSGYLTLYDGARRHFDQWAPGGTWEKGAGPCSREEALARISDPQHPWYRKPLWRTDCRKAMNALIQGSGARHTKLWMRAVWREGIVPLLQMHDSLDLSVTSPEQAELVARLGCEAIKLEVPMKVDIAFGRTWGDAKHPWAERDSAKPTVTIAAADEKRSSTTDSDSTLPPWEKSSGDEDITTETDVEDDEPPGTTPQPAHQVDWGAALEHDFPRAAAAQPPPTAPPETEAPQTAETPHPNDGNGYDSSGRPSPPGSPTPSKSSKAEAARDTHAEDHAGEPFKDSFLRWKGYRLVRVFDYTLADGTLIYQQNRYEKTRIAGKPHKRFLPHHRVNGIDVFGTGDRRVIYNWPAIMRAGPGSTVIITEGEANACALIAAGLLATTVLSHTWTSECIAALTGYHLIIVADHDADGSGLKLASTAQKKLAPVAASTRIVPTPHLWKHLPADRRDLKSSDDVEDWIELGGDPRYLLDICREIPADGTFHAEPYRFRVEADIAAWEWLYGRHLLRGEVSGTAAMGGTGKSTLSIVEALAMASGRSLLGEDVPRPLRVVLINLEDTRNTMDKRIAAAMLEHNLTPADVGDRLIVKAKGEVKVRVARQVRNGSVERNEAAIRALTNLMLEHHADVLSIDSFIRTHGVHENDNAAIQDVVECFEDVAVAAQCAVHLWHHTRKTGGERATIESIRGAAAFVDACRSARILETMSVKEHEQLIEIQPDMMPAGFYFRCFNGKRNFAPPAEQSDWYELENVLLVNGDDVGVVTKWQYPETQTDLPPEAIEHIFEELDRGLPNGQRYSNHNAAKKRAAWRVVRKHCPDKTQNQCRAIITAWIKKGLLYTNEYHDPVYDRGQNGLFVRKPTTEPTP